MTTWSERLTTMNIDMTVNDRFQDAHCFYGSLAG